MPQRDYMARSKKKKGANKSTLLSIIIILLLVAGLGLWLLKENAPAPTIPVAKEMPKSTASNASNLPSRPEEVYSYIRDLETREVITDPNKKSQEKLAQLSKEQLQQLEEKRKAEEMARLAAEKPAEAPAPVEATTTPAPTQETVVALTPEQLAAKKAQEQKLAEEKRKQAELKKQQELAKKAEQAKLPPVETAKADKAKVETAKKAEPTKVVATTAKPEKATQAGRFGLQCGAFKNKAQAENMQARLAMSGFNARIVSSGEWNRVFVGPVGDRAAASTAQSNARSVAECLIVSM